MLLKKTRIQKVHCIIIIIIISLPPSYSVLKLYRRTWNKPCFYGT